MKYFWLFSKDMWHSVWILSDAPINRKRTIKQEYRHLACPSCGKMDELTCLKLGLTDNIEVRTKYDIFHSAEKLMVVSAKFKNLLTSHKIYGLDYYPIPSYKHYFVTAPRKFAKVNSDHGNMRFFDRCKKCGRYESTTGMPPLGSIKIRRNQHLIFPELELECTYGHRYLYLISEHLAELIKKEKLKGYCFIEAT